ncbi:hypothetical protein TPHA_0I00800 [Tetrapisispora phaffii CBS 4417]|uniref:UNC-50 family protein n=1 Tax=Tetrapisispora phaffii (strain ATCC 24235 / CBS 4417 / NBRC 1672 / NRRL Y-8282 / UCD 70-5) TaxID=1071381 RepID=G8BXF8_TETPH|nr:hypothetical protein TPHA_0I00800 [Tetrapisispora phaffii CBS 4417]CCE64586.1 hypothetical protein TPHA_0I00800 [Tetrapisispora phaffii CBS 4417]
MSGLPVTIQDVNTNSNNNSPKAYIPSMFYRLVKTPKNLDFETAIYEMINLVFKPRKAFRSFYYQRQTKQQWAREDPSFFILQIALLTVSSVVWSIVYGHSFFGFLKMMINMIFIDFFLFGFTVASFFWLLLNRPMFKFRSAMQSRVEWAYCFDVHSNAFLIIWVTLYFLQFLLLPIIRLHKWIGIFVGNTLYCFSFAHYFILTFYGYSQLAFLKNINFILFPSLAFAVIYLISLLGFDLSKTFSFYH